MNRNRTAARGRPLAVFLGALVLLAGPLVAAQSPYLEVRQQLDPQTIYVTGTTGQPQVATLTLTVEGTGSGGRLPVDCLFVLDTSTTASIADEQGFTFGLLNLFSTQDRVGLVTYSSTAKLVVPLDADSSAFGAALGQLAASGKSALGDALKVGREELTKHGRDGAMLVEIVLTNGLSNNGRDPRDEGDLARDAGILIVPVGVGTVFNEALLEELASKTGGLFFARPSDSVGTLLQGMFTADLAARDVCVEEVLPPELKYARATPTPSRVKQNSDGTTTLDWTIASIGLGGQWQTQVDLRTAEKGAWSTDQSSSVVFADFRGRTQKLAIPGLTISAIEPNRAPLASFSVAPEAPTTADEVQFTDTSVGLDGHVASWKWDFGDGETSTLQSPQHRFAKSGTYTVALAVVDDLGTPSTQVRVNLDVASGPNLTATRAIQTCLPDFQTIPGGTVTVTVTIKAFTTLDGLTLHESIPSGWTLTPISQDRATFRADSDDWLFLETLQAGDVRVVQYTLSSPTTMAAGKDSDSVSINGLVASSSPRVSVMVLGDDKITSMAVLPIPVVISHWDTAQGMINPCLPDRISFDQLEYAVSLWLSGNPVPQTGNQKIDLKMLQDLTAYWRTNRSVFEPLP